MRYIRISDKFLSFFIDITQNYSPLDKIITFGRVAFCFVLLLSYPLLIVPCRATINKIIWSSNCRTDKEYLSSYKSRIMRWVSNSHHSGPNTVGEIPLELSCKYLRKPSPIYSVQLHLVLRTYCRYTIHQKLQVITARRPMSC